MINLIGQNMDFAQLRVKLGLRSGPKGTARVTVNDVLAQAPLSVSSAMKAEKNMGQLPLVPHMIHIQPRDNGDLEIDLNQVSHKALDTKSKIKFENYHFELVDSYDEEDDVDRGSDVHDMYGVQQSLWEQRREVEQTLAAQPEGEIAHRVISIVVSSPHVAMVTDSPITTKAGTELFTVQLGPREKEWSPDDGRFSMLGSKISPADKQGQSAALTVSAEEALRMVSQEAEEPPADIALLTIAEDEEVDVSEIPATNTQKPRTLTKKKPQNGHSNKSTSTAPAPNPCILGCPIFVSTMNNVKFMAQVPKVEVISR
jgi:hypothetical protein